MIRKDRNGLIWMLMDSDGNPMSRGDTITNFNGNVSKLDTASIPRHPASTGRVNDFFPSVFNLEWKVVEVRYE